MNANEMIARLQANNPDIEFAANEKGTAIAYRVPGEDWTPRYGKLLGLLGAGGWGYYPRVLVNGEPIKEVWIAA